MFSSPAVLHELASVTRILSPEATPFLKAACACWKPNATSDTIPIANTAEEA